jgi:hypothetical protein
MLLARTLDGCQSAPKFDPLSASNFDPLERRVRAVARAPSVFARVKFSADDDRPSGPESAHDDVTERKCTLDTPGKDCGGRSRLYCKVKANPDFLLKAPFPSSPNSRHNNKVVKAAAGIFGPRFRCNGHHIADAAPD